ncbi:MAG: extracellular solute-binding protein [Rectinemataceae bacterium]
MKKLLAIMLVALFAVGAVSAQKVANPTKIQLWTQEGQADGALQYVQALAKAYSSVDSKVTIEVVQKDTEALREDFQTASLAGNAPELLWTVSDHAGPFTLAELIQPVDSFAKLSDFVESVVIGGKTWGVPISSGNHLMLMYNKDFVKTAPKDTDEMIAIGKSLIGKVQAPLVFNFTEPFWLAPWIGGFGGRVFGADGKTPTLNTKAMSDALQFLYDLKSTYKIMPAEADYNIMDTLFKEGKAAMIINGDWALGEYQKTLGAKFAVAPIPMVKATGKYPAPYTSGKYFMVADGVKGDKLTAVKGFIAFATNNANQLDMVKTLKRLPALKAALEDTSIASDPILKGSSAQMAVGTPMPVVFEMRAIWDAMKPELINVLSGSKTAVAAAKDMQSAAEAGIKAMK